jgi:sugar lactone lactonase YvrE
MRRALLGVVATAAALAFAAAPALADQRAKFDTRVLAQIPSPGFSADSLVAPDGTVYAGSFENPAGDSIASRVFRFAPDGALETSYTIWGQDLSSPHGVQVAAIDAGGLLYLLDQSPPRVLTLDPRTGEQRVYATFHDLPSCSMAPTGAECSQTLVDNPPEPDYAAWGPDGSMYVTDYQEATIWRIPPGGGDAHVWLTDPRFDGLQFDAAGIVLKPDHRTLLVDTAASSPTTGPDFAQGKLYELPIQLDGKPGELRQLWESGATQAPDGFAVAQSGNIYLALVGPGANQIVELSPAGQLLASAPDPIANLSAPVPYDEPSSVQFDGDRLIVTNLAFIDGNASPNHQVLFDVWAGEPGMAIYHPPAPPVAAAAAATSAALPSLQLTVSPRSVTVGKRTRFRFRVTSATGASGGPVSGATVGFAGRATHTGRNGRASLTLTIHRAGSVRASARKHGFRPGAATVLATVTVR